MIMSHKKEVSIKGYINRRTILFNLQEKLTIYIDTRKYTRFLTQTISFGANAELLRRREGK